MLAGKHTHSRELTPSSEHYLRAILEARAQQGYARLTDVAKLLDVTPATLSVGLKSLEARGFVTHDPHRFLVLTPAGESVAREVHHRFEVLRTFLVDILGVTVPVAEQEACFIEHDVSGPTVDRMLQLVLEKRDNPALQAIVAGLSTAPPPRTPNEPCPTCGTDCIGPELGD
jgi:DtxR family Mn-dependent transcriptional regulator